MIRVTLADGTIRDFGNAVGYKIGENGLLRVFQEYDGETPEGFLKKGDRTIATFAAGWVSVETMEDDEFSLVDGSVKQELNKAIREAICQLNWVSGEYIQLSQDYYKTIAREQYATASELERCAVACGIMEPFPTR